MAEPLQYNSLPQLLRYADRNAMAFSRETRFPFLDHGSSTGASPARLICWYATAGRSSRFASPGRLAPAGVQWRADKVGYAAPLDVWLRGTAQDWALRASLRGSGEARAGIRPRRHRALWDDHQAGVGQELVGAVALAQPGRVARALLAVDLANRSRLTLTFRPAATSSAPLDETHPLPVLVARRPRPCGLRLSTTCGRSI